MLCRESRRKYRLIHRTVVRCIYKFPSPCEVGIYLLFLMATIGRSYPTRLETLYLNYIAPIACKICGIIKNLSNLYFNSQNDDFYHNFMCMMLTC